METLVSNPSRDYSAFLLQPAYLGAIQQNWFQTLPGIIPRFYQTWCLQVQGGRLVFQTLPGIIPRFYGVGPGDFGVCW
ncbi:hypothetical protein U27_01553 [Candidatus Vecturithrix granuli]|uniref:Uncharacterized protein n=1 Tax=Vecturithrix granuli TaxID=1499967 RepID=A0A081CAP7_VECG1|nr:hypothetical protein U27_01553 [Candidatus Vecturithrix granuli]